MSQENVEIVRQAFRYEYFGVGGRAEAAMYFTADFEMDPTECALDEEHTVGRGSIRKNFERWASAWESLEVRAEEFLDAGDRVLVTIHHTGRVQGSEVDIEARAFVVYTLREGKVARINEFPELTDARSAAGLSE
jgi:ketosteroid isomerase-like protein